ncbi:MAG: CheR family methyltransferase [Beijerinckiaceae bacterium]
MIAKIMHDEAGIYLPPAKNSLVFARLSKRLRALNLTNFKDYCNLVTSDRGHGERRQMLSALTTNVTNFFREKHHFEHMRLVSLPPLLKRAREGGRVRLWSAGCSTGQEPYSIAFTILMLEPRANSLDLRILATDIDPKVVETGARGLYHERDLAGVPAEVRDRWVHKVAGSGNGMMEISEEVCDLISFRELNLNSHWPMRGQFDIVFCRNTVIYFNGETQAQAWNNFGNVIPSGGWLYIGHSERISGPAEAFFSNLGTTTYRKK